MQENIIVSLVQNVAILLSFTLLYDYFWLNTSRNKTVTKKIIIGLAIGFITLVVMYTPGILAPGIVFDTRSVLLSVSGLFFGAFPTIIAMLIAATYRIFVGGDGMLMGVSVIFTAGFIGIMWGYFRPAWREKKIVLELLLMGLLVHLAMLSCTVLLPENLIWSTIKAIFLVLLLIYVPATALIGWFMVRQENNYRNRKVNEKLVESERRFTDMLTNVQLLSVILDNNGDIVFCNEYFLKLVEYRYYEIVGKSWVDLFVVQEQKSEIRKTIVDQNISSHYEGQIITKSGKLLDINWSNVLLRDESDASGGIASIGENITDKKLADQNLLFAKEKAEQSDSLKTVFLSNMSHEIRTPLNSIVGFSELLTDVNIDNKQRTEYYNIVKNSGNKLMQIINDILDISKLETKQFNIYRTTCSLNDIMNNTFESFKNSIDSNQKENIELSLDFPEYLHDFKFESDQNRIEQVLDNLITNAIKYTEIGTIEFGVSSSLINGVEFLEFYVKDTGIGIEEKMYSLIFDRFRQVEENSFHNGSGIGLSICKGIVELLGGKIWVDSKIGKGSMFAFTVPYILDTEIKQQKLIPEQIILNFMNKKVIIAEDDRNSFFYLNALLKGHGLNIKHAPNGDSLMQMLETDVPDLILLDLNMPGKSGYDCLDEIKDKGIKTKIIAQTAYAGCDERDRCLLNGCADYISKPIKRNELYSVINRVMSE